ncbi:MAG TPA: hypothetical protein VHX90_04305 [Verrucomicrobiae bacterium]|nr:hypothetical protein [Verrucomicrobiae bacterium]
MKLSILSVCILMAGLICKAEPPPDAVVQKLTTVIHEQCPDAIIDTTNGLYIAKYGTMMFTLHSVGINGEISSKTYQAAGPNFKGFILIIGIEKGPYQGQAVIPQELKGPYFPTFIDAPLTEDGKNHYWITFSYGGRLDPKLKEAIFKALAKQPGNKWGL